MNSKVQCEARILPKRRVSKTPAHLLENGGFNEADLTLAIQESLKSARKSQKRESEIKENSVSCHSTSDNNQTRMAGKLTNNDCSQQEIKQLKELLLLHLEMIRHQEQLLVAKDQEIKTLQSEKEAVRFFMFNYVEYRDRKKWPRKRARFIIWNCQCIYSCWIHVYDKLLLVI